MQTVRLFVLFAAAGLSMASASPPHREPGMKILSEPDDLPYEPISVKTSPPITDEDLYVSALRLLSDREMVPRDKDPLAMTISGEWLVTRPVVFLTEDRVRVELKKRHSIAVIVHEGVATIRVDCLERGPAVSVWSPCATGSRDAGFVRAAQWMAREISPAARKRAEARSVSLPPSTDAGQQSDASH